MKTAEFLLDRLLRIKSKYRSVILALIDMIAIALCFVFTWSLLLDRASLLEHSRVLFLSTLLLQAAFLVTYAGFGMYRSVWRYAETTEFFHCALAMIFALLLFTFGVFFVGFTHDLPISSFLLAGLLSAAATLYYRMAYRLLRSHLNRGGEAPQCKRVMVVGTGESGATLIHELNRGKNPQYRVVCALDDDIGKIDKEIVGVKVVGRIALAPVVAKEYLVDTIIICLPSATSKEMRRALTHCNKAKCHLQTLGSLAELVGKDQKISSSIRDVSVEDLLGRNVIDIGKTQYDYVRDEVVLVTGGGGSIGSELCRQIAASKPKTLVLVDIYENNAYEIQQELLRTHGEQLDLRVEIASVRDLNKMDFLFAKYRPSIVFHAAAHKHVPLMETVPEEAIKNNIYGTYHVATCADRYGARRFVMISTDKAVNPTNVMGATKRACEIIIQSMDRISKTEFVAVRFGNVLGSNGSVIPLFKQQIAQGGPVTVTHPDIIRYFMTISEAVSLVLTAGEMAKGGEIFVLDMGDPVKILDLAENLIRLSGFEPYREIPITFSGLRPGEKLFEELLMTEEGLKETPNHKIFIGASLDISPNRVFSFLEENESCAGENDSAHMVALLQKLVPTYHMPVTVSR